MDSLPNSPPRMTSTNINSTNSGCGGNGNSAIPPLPLVLPNLMFPSSVGNPSAAHAATSSSSGPTPSSPVIVNTNNNNNSNNQSSAFPPAHPTTATGGSVAVARRDILRVSRLVRVPTVGCPMPPMPTPGTLRITATEVTFERDGGSAGGAGTVAAPQQQPQGPSLIFSLPLKALHSVTTHPSGTTRLCFVTKAARVEVVDFGKELEAKRKVQSVLQRLAATKTPLDVFLLGIQQQQQQQLAGLPKSPTLRQHRDHSKIVENEILRSGAVASGAWTLSHVNADHSLCESYPAIVAVPVNVPDHVVEDAARFRGASRFPILSYYHAGSGAALCRCAQPMTGLTNATNNGDVKFLSALASCNGQRQLCIVDLRPYVNAIGNTFAGRGYEDVRRYHRTSLSFHNIQNIHVMRERHRELMQALIAHNSSVYQVDSAVLAGASVARTQTPETTPTSINVVEGGTSTPTQQQVGMTLEGSGDSSSPPAVSPLLGGAAAGGCNDASSSCNTDLWTLAGSSTPEVPGMTPNDELALAKARTAWVGVVETILRPAVDIANALRAGGANVLVHCSDGWDRTSQVCALVQVLLDGHCRTVEGFLALIEKEWVQCGHRFASRTGMTSPGISGSTTPQPPPHQQATTPPVSSMLRAESEFATAASAGTGMGSVRHSSSTQYLTEEEVDGASSTGATAASLPNTPRGSGGAAASSSATSSGSETQVSPVFFQFLDVVHQLMLQHPGYFEFKVDMLLYIADALYSARFYNFLFDTPKEQAAFLDGANGGVDVARLGCLYSHILDSPALMTAFRDNNYDKTGTQAVPLQPSLELVFWRGYFYRYGRHAVRTPSMTASSALAVPPTTPTTTTTTTTTVTATTSGTSTTSAEIGVQCSLGDVNSLLSTGHQPQQHFVNRYGVMMPVSTTSSSSSFLHRASTPTTTHHHPSLCHQYQQQHQQQQQPGAAERRSLTRKKNPDFGSADVLNRLDEVW